MHVSSMSEMRYCFLIGTVYAEAGDFTYLIMPIREDSVSVALSTAAIEDFGYFRGLSNPFPTRVGKQLGTACGSVTGQLT